MDQWSMHWWAQTRECCSRRIAMCDQMNIASGKSGKIYVQPAPKRWCSLWFGASFARTHEKRTSKKWWKSETFSMHFLIVVERIKSLRFAVARFASTLLSHALFLPVSIGARTSYIVLFGRGIHALVRHTFFTMSWQNISTSHFLLISISTKLYCLLLLPF